MTPEQTPGTDRTTYQQVHRKIDLLLKVGKSEEAQGLADTFSKQTRQAVENGEPPTFSEAEKQSGKSGTARSPVLYMIDTIGES